MDHRHRRVQRARPGRGRARGRAVAGAVGDRAATGRSGAWRAAVRGGGGDAGAGAGDAAGAAQPARPAQPDGAAGGAGGLDAVRHAGDRGGAGARGRGLGHGAGRIECAAAVLCRASDQDAATHPPVYGGAGHEQLGRVASGDEVRAEGGDADDLQCLRLVGAGDRRGADAAAPGPRGPGAGGGLGGDAESGLGGRVAGDGRDGAAGSGGGLAQLPALRRRPAWPGAGRGRGGAGAGDGLARPRTRRVGACRAGRLRT